MMNPIQRWRSNDRPLKRLRDELDEVFDRFFDEPFFSKDSLWDPSKPSAFTPACNIKEKKNRYIIEVEIPGVDPDDVEIEISGNVMTISGEKKEETTTEDKDEQMQVIEHRYGSFYRSFTLPDNIQTDNISADNKNGILYITIPKEKESKIRRIKIGKRQ